MSIKKQIISKNEIKVYKSKKIIPVKLINNHMRKVKRMENVCAVPRNNMTVLSGDKIDEFVMKSKNGAMKKLMAKLDRLDKKKEMR